MRRICYAFFVFFLVAVTASAHSYKLGAIEIGHPWTAPTNGGSAVVNLALANHSAEADQLVGAATPIGKAALLDAENEPLAEIEMAPRRPVALRAGHPHIAIAGLAKPLAAGSSFPLTLAFAKAGKIDIAVMVEATQSD